MRTLIAAALLLPTLVLYACHSPQQTKQDTTIHKNESVYRHVVVFKFKDSTTDAQIQEIVDDFADLPNQTTPRNGSLPQSPFLGSEKGHIKNGSPAIRPKFLFVAIVDRGRVDVFDIGTAEKVRSIDMGGIPAVLGSYWRQ